ncbi:MAG: DUF1015 domain-containing protein [Clostridia bacterium]
MQTKNLCIYPGELLLPADANAFPAWACVACDQYTSQPQYWQEARLHVGEQPSTLKLIVPECDLESAEQRIPAIHQTMRDYVASGVLTPAVQNGFVLVERSTGSGARVGLVALLDLECYDYRKGSQSLVRATEETIEARIPPRLKLRRGAALETSHVLMLMDDPMMSVVEPLFERRRELRKLYDFPLMMGGGHLTGYAVTDPADIQAVYSALDKLRASLEGEHPLLFAVGDGNHSLATAKAYWEEVKKTLTPEQTTVHPARFAMVELENLQDDALVFEPIHRVLFGYDGDDMLDELARYAGRLGASLAADAGAQEITVVYEGKQVTLSVSGSPYALAVGTLQAFLDQWVAEHPGTRVDYIHGEDVVRTLAAGEGTIGFLLPKPDKSALLPTVVKDGALPRKTFSMGEANEKRYYMECRRL